MIKINIDVNDEKMNIDNKWRLMLLSLKSNSQTQRYIYKIVIVCMQAVSIIWSKLISDRGCHLS